MAIPYMMPRDEVAPEDRYRRLERLLCELYLVLRALFGRNAEPPAAAPDFHHHQPRPPQPPAQGSSAPGGSRPAQSGVPRRPYPTSQRFPPNMTSSGSSTTPKSTDQMLYWFNLGHQLRDIADNFKTARVSSKPKNPDFKSCNVPILQIQVHEGTIKLIKAET